jgi:hypothetical protein
MNTTTPLQFFTDEDVMAMLHLTRDELVQLSEAKVLLAMNLSSGELCFPQFQFTDDDFDGELISLFQLFPESWSGWDVTNWFHKTNSYLSATPIELFRSNCITSTLRLVISMETTLQEL